MNKLPILLLIGSILFFSYSSEKTVPVTADNALMSYLSNGDKSYEWEVVDTIYAKGIVAYNLLLTSQKWREHLWKHQLTILVPEELEHDGAMVFITGGSVKDGMPKWTGANDETLQAFGKIALANKAITAVLKQVPNQPLYTNLTEDELISFTLHNFKEDFDYTWPLLFPMTKSAIRSMDAIQDFSNSKLNKDINRFLICGASKRGWTTWLTGATDKRVEAIAPMVIDVLNMSVNLDYQVEVWQDYSIQIQDYVKLGIPQQAKSDTGSMLIKMIDPYAYRAKLTMPKLIFIGTNDEYWPVDAIKHYIDSIPGINHIHYVPNAGHNLGDKKQALKALSAFFGYTLNRKPYPVFEYNISLDADGTTIEANALPDELIDVSVWSADAQKRDFRKSNWLSESLDTNGSSEVSVKIPFPKEGFKAFYLDFKFKDLNGGHFTMSSRMFVADKDELFLK
ncbi:MAG: PhoPQ-activated pathogenicity-related family protein [Cyclobacteriaceae bacterium]